MQSDVNGISQCEAGQEHYEQFCIHLGSKTRTLVQYDYRTPGGVLFSCIAASVEIARRNRDRWLQEGK